MVSLMLMVLSMTLLCGALGEREGSALRGTASTTSTSTQAMSVDTTWSWLASEVADQISFWEHSYNTSKLVAMKEWSSTAARIVTDYSLGEPLSSAMKKEAMNHLPQVAKTVPGSPLLAFGATAFVSFFGEAAYEAEKLAALNKQLMAEVGDEIVDEHRFTMELDSVKEDQEIAEMVMEIKAMPSFAGDAPAGADASWYAERMAFWNIRMSSFNTLVIQVFSASCVNNEGNGPRTNPSEWTQNQCKAFQNAGAIGFQVPYVLTHITILLQLAEFLTPAAQQQQYIDMAKTEAGIYYALLKDSLDSYAKIWQKTIAEDIAASYDGILADIQAVAKAK